MTKESLMKDMQEIDNLLARVVNPAMTRIDHDAVREVMQELAKRVILSFEQEEQLKQMRLDAAEAQHVDAVDM